MAVLPVQDITKSGVVPTLNTPAGGGDSFANNGKVAVWIENAHASETRTVTFVTQQVVDGSLAVGDRAVTVTAAQDRKVVCELDPVIYNDANGRVNMTYDSVTGLTIAVFKLTGT